MVPALCTIMVIEMFEFSKQRGNPHRKLQTIIFNWFRLSRDNYWRGEVEIVRESDEDVESEIERSIFNMVMPTRVGRERLFTCPVEWEIFFFPDELMYLYPDGVNQCSFSFIMCMPSVSGKQPLGMGFGPNLGWGLGFGIPPFRTVL